MHTVRHSLEARKRMSESSKGQVPWNKGKTGVYSKEAIKKFSEAKTNLSPEARKKIATNGFKPGNKPWNKGIGTKSTLNELARKTLQARLWRVSIFERDNYTCQNCNARGGKLHAHHIKPFSTHPELRYAIDNGLTLYVNCHRDTDTWGFHG